MIMISEAGFSEEPSQSSNQPEKALIPTQPGETLTPVAPEQEQLGAEVERFTGKVTGLLSKVFPEKAIVPIERLDNVAYGVYDKIDGALNRMPKVVKWASMATAPLIFPPVYGVAKAIKEQREAENQGGQLGVVAWQRQKIEEVQRVGKYIFPLRPIAATVATVGNFLIEERIKTYNLDRGSLDAIEGQYKEVNTQSLNSPTQGALPSGQ